jgi:hypothetical protein
MANETEKKGTKVFSQIIDIAAVSTFNKFATKVAALAQDKGLREPSKGEILTFLLKKGAVDTNVEEYFLNK